MMQPPFAHAVILTVITCFAISSSGSQVDDHKTIGLRESSDVIRQQNEAIREKIQRTIARRPGVRLRPHQRIRPGSPLFDLSKIRREINVARDLHQANHDVNKVLKKVERYPNKEVSSANVEKRNPHNDVSTLLDEIRRSGFFARSADKDRRSNAVESVRRSHFPELLNCRVINPFPAPDDHISCCEKTELCECPRPMGECKLNDDDDDDGKDEGESESSGFSTFVERN